MRTIRALGIILTVAAMTSCARNSLPGRYESCAAIRKLEGKPGSKGYPAALVARVDEARGAWAVLCDPAKKAEWPEAMKKYNETVLMVLHWHRAQGAGFARASAEWPYEVEFEKGAGGLGYDPRSYRDIIPASLIRNNGSMKERYVQDGIGVAAVGWIPPKNLKAAELPYLKDAGVFEDLTALLVYPDSGAGRPTLKFLLRVAHESMETGKMKAPHALAADYSASTIAAWTVSRVDDIKLLSVFRPVDNADRYGLYIREQYDPEKIPLVLVHGLASSPQTFNDLINRLFACPDIRRNYQVWCFSYPTGLPWMASARNMRKDIQDLRKRLDPRHENANWDKMVVMGHSMGGLISRYNLTADPGELLGNSLSGIVRNADSFRKEYAKAATPEVAETFEFEPLPAKRMIFMATPHRGSDFADFWPVRYVTKLIQLPAGILDEVSKIVTMDQDMLLMNPEEIPYMMTSVRQLSPKSPFIRALQKMPLKAGVEVHSIIGVNNSDRPLPKTSDGVVTYQSSHYEAAASEKAVPSGHSLTDDYEAFRETLRILRLHLHENKKEVKTREVAPARVVVDPDHPESDVRVVPRIMLPQ